MALLPHEEPQPTKECCVCRNSLPEGKTQQSVNQYKIVSSENIYASNIPWTEQIIFRNTYVYLYTYKSMHVTRIMNKEPMNLKECKEEYMSGLEKGKGKEHVVIILKSQK